nr:RsiV family protein [Bacteroidales bacterium]
IPGYENELNNTAEKIFRAEKQLSPDANLESEGFWFEGNKFYLNKNFGIKNDGLVFYFNSYEIAPYAMGPTEIKIPYATIKKLVLNDGPLSKMPM